VSGTEPTVARALTQAGQEVFVKHGTVLAAPTGPRELLALMFPGLAFARVHREVQELTDR